MSDFWTRRKAAVAADEAVVEDASVAAVQSEDTRCDEEILEELGLPAPEALEEGDDVRAFMAAAVPDRLRRRALRQLWRVNPALANLDGLVDYGEDFTDAATVVENLQTAYQVGKGMLKHVEALAAQAEAEAAEDLEEAPEDLDEEIADEATEKVVEVAEIEHVGSDVVGVPEGSGVTHFVDDDLERAPAPRRMTFRFEAGAGV